AGATSSSAGARAGEPGRGRARVDRDAAVGEAHHRVQVELGDLRQVLGGVGGRRAAIAADGPSGLAAENELLGVDIGERRDPEAGVADQCVHLLLVAQASVTPPVSVLCAPAAAVLTTTGKPSSAAAATASSASAASCSSTSGTP